MICWAPHDKEPLYETPMHWTILDTLVAAIVSLIIGAIGYFAAVQYFNSGF